jgi:hypothetical protein
MPTIVQAIRSYIASFICIPCHVQTHKYTCTQWLATFWTEAWRKFRKPQQRDTVTARSTQHLPSDRRSTGSSFGADRNSNTSGNTGGMHARHSSGATHDISGSSSVNSSVPGSAKHDRAHGRHRQAQQQQVHAHLSMYDVCVCVSARVCAWQSSLGACQLKFYKKSHPFISMS